jgi:hypothetical protein
MKIVKFKGGLGNQLFQYAFLRSLQLKYSCKNVKGDFSYYAHVKNDSIRVPRIESLNIKINKADDKDLNNVCMLKHPGNPLGLVYKGLIFAEHLLNRKYYFELDRRFRDVNRLIKYDYFDGYWQSWRYLDGIEGALKKEITFKKKFNKKTEEVISEIKNQNSVLLGVRRGDYIATSKARKHFGTFDIEYYLRAIEYVRERVRNPVFYIFSNDIQWVKQNMKFDCNVVFRNSEDQASDIEELFIMAACKHAIIVNSTFYWWGAWLIDNAEKIVIAPKKWFADDKPIDIVPDNWVKM